MAIEQITERIVADARRQAGAIVAEAEARAEQVVAEAKRRVEEERERRFSDARLEVEAQAQQLITSARLASRDRILAVKQEVIDEVFRLALERLQALDTKATLTVLTSRLLEIVRGGEEIILGQRDHQRLGQLLVDEINTALAKKNLSPVRLVSEPAEMNGGFIVRLGRVEENHSFVGMVADLREELEADIARLLWA